MKMKPLVPFLVPLLLALGLALSLGLGGCLPSPGEQKPAKIDPVWSPDGARIAFTSNQGGKWAIYVIDLATNEVRRLTDEKTNAIAPAWSPDGKRLTFSSDRSGQWEIYLMEADGSNVRPLTAGK
jgi:TolB protein